jgi:xanthine dehydrogenase accessory factor
MSTPDSSLVAKALDWLGEGREVALATVIQTWGSAPQPAGSLLLIDADENFQGSVSGGCVEADVITAAADVIATGKPKTLEFGVADETAWRAGLACGGAIRILVTSLMQRQDPSAQGVLRRLLDDVEARRGVALVTELASGAQSLAHADGSHGDLAGSLAELFRHDKSVTVSTSDGELFINVFNPAIRLIVVGAVHVAQPLVTMARAVGYDVIIVDPRTAFATEERFTEARIVREWPDAALAEIGLDARTAVVALTHDPKIDDPALALALASDAFYVGALGSRKTHAKRVERLLAAGVDAASLERIHAPIGLDIGAIGASEIALSIVAEIAAVQRGKAG